MSDKTEEPTPRRLKKSREEGDSGASREVGHSLGFLVAITLVPAALAAVAESAIHGIHVALDRAAARDTSIAFDGRDTAIAVIAAVAPILLAVGITSAVSSLVQTGGVIATSRLTPKLERLNVIQGLANLFSAQRAFSILRAAFTGTVVAYVAYRGLRAHAVDIARVAGRIAWVGPVAGAVAMSIARDVAFVGIGLAAIDIVIVRRGWRKRLLMTKEEVKREHKDSEGDPQLKASRERAHHELLASATIANVKNASVVVVNPTHIACALRYEGAEGDEAPVLVARGEGDLAQAIIRAAHDYGVPVLRDVPLARALVELEVGDAIPEALYEAVAEILREAWSENEKKDASAAGGAGVGDRERG